MDEPAIDAMHPSADRDDDERDPNWAHLLLLLGLPTWMVLSVRLDPTISALSWVLLSFAILLAFERLMPHRRDWAQSSRSLPRDTTVVSLSLVSDAVATALLGVLATSLSPDESRLGFTTQLLLAVVLGELGSYCLHRLSHVGGWLWRIHLLHHVPDRLNTANAFVAHPLNVVAEKLLRLAPAVCLGFSDQVILASTLFVVTQSLVVHANVSGSMGALNWIIGTAELHRLHHSTDPAEAGNFGTALPIWDLIFCTYREPKTDPLRVGVFDPSSYPSEFRTLELLAWPFWPVRHGHDAHTSGTVGNTEPAARESRIEER